MNPPERIDRAGYLRLVRGQTRGTAAALGRSALAVASIGYGAVVRARNWGYDLGLLRTNRAAVPVVSVGNLTLGGTGKTPMVEWVARRLRAQELRVAILSRGYGQKAGLNDEGRVLEDNLPDVPHLQGADRTALAQTAVEQLESQILVLDDGFQHRRLARDLDIVLLDALEPFGLGKLFPRGLLREPVSSLKRAGVVVLSRADLVDAATRAGLRQTTERHAGPLRWAEARHAPLDLVDGTGAVQPLEILRDRTVAAFCGLGNPEGFRRTLASLSGTTVAFRVFPDHHAYSAHDVHDIERWAGESRADLVLTTQKDLVKIRVERFATAPLFALRIGLEILSGGDVLAGAIAAAAKDAPPAPT